MTNFGYQYGKTAQEIYGDTEATLLKRVEVPKDFHTSKKNAHFATQDFAAEESRRLPRGLVLLQAARRADEVLRGLELRAGQRQHRAERAVLQEERLVKGRYLMLFEGFQQV